MLERINAIILKTVKAYPFDLCRQPKSFSFLSHKEKLASSSFGMNYSDYQKGYYWGRSFEATGASVDCIAAEKPAVYLKQNGIIESNASNKECLTFELGIVDIVDCDTCGEDCRRTEGEIKRDLHNTLTAIRNEILRNFPYFVEYLDGTTAEIWATDKEVSSNPNIIESYRLHDKGKLETNLKFLPRIDIVETAYEKQIAAFIQFTFCDCNRQNIVFDYTQIAFDKSAAATCHTCI